MRSLPVTRAFNGDFATPHEINEDIRELQRVLHALDTENFVAGSISAQKLALGATGTLKVETRETTQSTVHTVGSFPNDLYLIPDDANDPWAFFFETTDGALQVSLSQDVADSLLANSVCPWVGVRVDGQLVAQSWHQGILQYRDSLFCESIVPIGPGRHFIEAVYSIWPGPTGTLPATRTLNWRHGIFTMRELAR